MKISAISIPGRFGRGREIAGALCAVLVTLILTSSCITNASKKRDSRKVWIHRHSNDAQCGQKERNYASLNDAIEFLDDLDVKVYARKEEGREVCEGCSCPSGTVYLAKVSLADTKLAAENSWYIDEDLNRGFLKVEKAKDFCMLIYGTYISETVVPLTWADDEKENREHGFFSIDRMRKFELTYDGSSFSGTAKCATNHLQLGDWGTVQILNQDKIRFGRGIFVRNGDK